jgi:hypothetical protein
MLEEMNNASNSFKNGRLYAPMTSLLDLHVGGVWLIAERSVSEMVESCETDATECACFVDCLRLDLMPRLSGIKHGL